MCDSVSTSSSQTSLFRFVPSGSCPYTSTFRRPTVHVRSSERTDSCGPPLASVFRTVLYCILSRNGTVCGPAVGCINDYVTLLLRPVVRWDPLTDLILPDFGSSSAGLDVRWASTNTHTHWHFLHCNVMLSVARCASAHDTRYSPATAPFLFYMHMVSRRFESSFHTFPLFSVASFPSNWAFLRIITQFLGMRRSRMEKYIY